MERTKVLNIWEKIGEDNQMDNEGPKSSGEEQFSHDQGEMMSMKIFFGAQITSRFVCASGPDWFWVLMCDLLSETIQNDANRELIISFSIVP